MKKQFRILLALILALAMVMGNVMTVMAEDPPITDSVRVENGDLVSPPSPEPPTFTGNEDEGYVVNGSIDHDFYDDYNHALEVSSDDNENPSVITVKGNVESDYSPVSVTAENGGTATATIEGNAIADDLLAVFAVAKNSGTATVTVEGSATADGFITVEAYAHDKGTMNVTIGENITAPDEDDVAIHTYNGKSGEDSTQGGTVNINVGGDVKGNILAYSQDQGTTTIDVDGSVEGYVDVKSNSGYGYNDASGTINLTVGEGVTGQVEVQTSDQGSATLTIENGGVNAEIKEYGAAVKITNGTDLENNVRQEGGTVKATITGNIVATGSENSFETAGIMSGNVGGTTNIEIKQGNVTVSGEGELTYGIGIANCVCYTGKPQDDKEEDFSGKDRKPVMTGDYVAPDGYYGSPLPLYVFDEGGEKTYYIMYREEEQEKYVPIDNLKTEQQAVTSLTMTGNVNSSQYGVIVSNSEGQKTDIIIDGTVDGKEAGLVLMNNTKLDNSMTMTVWAVELRDGGAVFSAEYNEDYQRHNQLPQATADGNQKDEEGMYTLKQDEDAEAQLQYIIRIKPEQKDIIAAGTDAFKFGDYMVAREKQTVTIELKDIPEGYEITGAYGDAAETVKLEKNEKGQYFLTVPKGGGVQLSVILTKKPEPPKPSPEPDPEPEPTAPETVTITYVLGNDAQYDHIRTTAAVGERVALQPAPERDGYTFLYWQGTDVDPSSPYYKEPNPDSDFQFRPGASYTAKKDYNFVAVWQKN